MIQPTPPSQVDWNRFFNVAGYTALIAVAITVGVMIIFVVVYRDRAGLPKFKPQRGLHRSRARDMAIFAVISIIILFVLSVLSFTLTPKARFLPSTAPNVEIKVEAYQWGFRYFYPNGVISQVANVPESATILFNVTSTDVYHNFYIPDFRVSIDAIPGRYNLIWVPTPSLNGNSQATYYVMCKELCGVGHTYMFSRLVVMSQSDFNQWLTNQTNTMPSGG